MWNLNSPVNCPNLVNGFDFRTETTMDTQHFAVDNGSQWQIIKYFCAVFPWIRVAVLPVDFVVETIDLRDLPKS